MGRRGDLQRRLDALGRRDGKERFCDAGTETGQDGARTAELAVLVGEEALVLVKGDES